MDAKCPWCEIELALPLDVEADAQTCPECLTTWRYEDAPELALAA